MGQARLCTQSITPPEVTRHFTRSVITAILIPGVSLRHTWLRFNTWKVPDGDEILIGILLIPGPDRGKSGSTCGFQDEAIRVLG